MTSEFNYAGSCWWKVDFHCHTPASDDYGKGPNQEELKKISPEDWLLNYMKKEVDCVVIADHNSGEWIDKLKDAFLILKDQNHPEFRPIHIFPGAEISVNGGVHILAILPKEKRTSDVASLLGAVEYDGTHGKCETCTNKSVNEVITKIIHLGGIAIPAHVDIVKGIFKEIKGPTLEKILDINEICAMELLDSSFSKPPSYLERNLSWTEVLGSDSHYPSESSSTNGKYPGSHYTWVKMSEPNLEGLNLALLDGNKLSIRRSDENISNPNLFDHHMIESITIENACYMGNGSPFICNFSPWLNTIIGGRGTGKSTILEFIRLYLQRKDDAPKSIKNDLEKYCKIRKSRDDEGLIKEGTKISTIIQKDKIRYKIIWDQEYFKGKILSESPLGDWASNDGDIKQRFPIKLFSQKEIFELSKDQQSLLRIIDESPDVIFHELSNNIEKIKNKYLSLKSQIREKELEINEESTLKGELQDINTKIDLLEQSENKEKLLNYNLASKRKKEIESWRSSILNIKETIEASFTTFSIKKIDTVLFKDDSNFIERYTIHNSKIEEILNVLHDITKETENIFINFNAEFEKTEVYRDIEIAYSNYQQLIEELKREGIENINQYQPLIAKREAILDKLEKIKKLSLEKTDLIEQSKKCLTNIDENREKIIENRKNFINNILSKNDLISIEIIPFGNFEDFKSSFRSLINKSSGFEKDIDKLVDLVINDPNHREGVSKIKQKILNIYSGVDDDIEDKRFLPYISGLEPEIIDKLMCFYPEDSIDVKYYDQKTGDYTPIKKGSPGQKTAALLSFLLSYGNEPLILDQPEDDLENRLIYDLVVNQIKKIKSNRQVIIVTHNANIVVNGDSENLIPLIIGNNAQTTIKGQGGMQEKEIRDEICTVLEGGKEAFNLRYKRINV